MAQTPTRLYAGTPANGVTLYTVPVGKTMIVKQILLITGSAGLTVTISGAVQFTYQLALPQNGVTILDLSQVLNAGETITFTASTASACNVAISGVVSP